jgi:hypothetical protein
MEPDLTNSFPAAATVSSARVGVGVLERMVRRVVARV